MAKPVAAGSFVRPALNGRPAATSEAFLVFVPELRLDDLDGRLETTGFAGVDGFAGLEKTLQPPTPIGEPAPPPPVTIPAERPILEVKLPAAPIAIYEPIEFMEFDDEEDDPFPAARTEVEPEEAEPEFVPPPARLSPLSVEPLQPAAPARAKAQQGFAPLTFGDPPLEIPESAVRTRRPRLYYGANPAALKPAAVAVPVKPVPAVAKPAPQPAKTAPPAVTPRPAAAAAASTPARPEPAPSRSEKDKRGKSGPTPPAPVRPVRDRGNAVPVEEPAEEAPVSAPALPPKPKMVPIRKPEPLAPAATVDDGPKLGVPEVERSGGMKIAIVAAVVVGLSGAGYMIFSGGKSSSAGAGAAVTDSAVPGMVIGGGGWTTTWGSDALINKGKQISIYRPSMTMPDYRFEFFGQIERKAMGWIFRASNPKNYYVMKLETIKPGTNPLVALVKYAVIDGKETTRTQVMLPFDVKLGTTYQVRLDVKGDKFSTSVQGKLVDFWNDDRIKVGGAGFYTDNGERAQIKSSQISYLR